jgi:predicted  nucleic acid-binding Zn-ribbon protein
MHGPGRKPASVDFGPGLNVLYGASDTGKSFVVEVIDFMLGGKPPIPDITERIGYDQILLGIETLTGELFTLIRSAAGGGFRLYRSILSEPPATEVEAIELGEQHSDKSPTNLSTFLLEKCGLAGKRVRKNKAGVTISLSFRNLARLSIVNEIEIIQKRSPLSEGNPTTDTSNFATFKLLLTGVDDAALVPTSPRGPEEQSREGQLELLDKLLDDHRERLDELTKFPDELQDQYKKIQSSIAKHQTQLSSTEAEFREIAERRRDQRKRLEGGRDRRAEIASLLERFALLDRHYVSDVARLRGIEEGGTLFEILGEGPCPLCGADPAHHRKDAECDANVSAVIVAARNELAKIDLLRRELATTVTELRREGASFDRRLPKLENELDAIARQVESMISPKLAKLRATYAELADKRGRVKEAMSVYLTIQDIEHRRNTIETGSFGSQESAVADGDLPTATADKFARQVEAILKAWHFPEANRVFFDPKAKDLVIDAKPRTARGKGLRAITHAAFTIGLLEYCKVEKTPHPGFVVLDSPLLAYRAPEGKEDDLRGTDLNEQFYSYLANQHSDRQVIVVENSDPPANIQDLPHVLMFSANPHSGRYGFFPVEM